MIGPEDTKGEVIKNVAMRSNKGKLLLLHTQPWPYVGLLIVNIMDLAAKDNSVLPSVWVLVTVYAWKIDMGMLLLHTLQHIHHP